MSDDSRKLCIDCKHHAAPQYGPLECHRPGIEPRINLVNGHEMWPDCYEQRIGVEIEGSCNIAGQFWEKK